MRCLLTQWRGVTVCAHTRPLLEAWAAACGTFRLTPIQGSYSSGVAASAGTHAGGGALDTKGSKDDRVNALVTDAGRAQVLVVWHRDDADGWKPDHHHALDPACPNLSPAAAAQVREFIDGGDGLKGSGPDTGSRAWVGKVRRAYDHRGDPPPPPAKPPAKPPAGDDMFNDEDRKLLQEIKQAQTAAGAISGSRYRTYTGRYAHIVKLLDELETELENAVGDDDVQP